MVGKSGAIRLSSSPMGKYINRIVLIVGLMACVRLAPLPANAADNDAINAAPGPQDWQALAKLPDWSGGWTAAISDQVPQEERNPPPGPPQVAKAIKHRSPAEQAG